MNCAYHPDSKAVTRCSNCRQPLCSTCASAGGSGTLLCSRCIALQAADAASGEIKRRRTKAEANQQKPQERKARKKKILAALQWLVLAASVAIMGLQAPKVLSVFEEEAPIRQGSYATDENTDACIQNLWRWARLLQEGKEPDADLVCPASGAAYGVTSDGGNVVVRCPNPQDHGFSEISVSRDHPVPRLVK